MATVARTGGPFSPTTCSAWPAWNSDSAVSGCFVRRSSVHSRSQWRRRSRWSGGSGARWVRRCDGELPQLRQRPALGAGRLALRPVRGSSPGQIGVPGHPGRSHPIRGGIWRYHPNSKLFEPLCHGTTNPWGHDWNALGEGFFINTVNGHLWHLIPGATSSGHTRSTQSAGLCADGPACRPLALGQLKGLTRIPGPRQHDVPRRRPCP